MPLFNASYRMTVQDAQADDCDFWVALVGQDAKIFASFAKAIDEAIPDRAGIVRIEPWIPRGAQEAALHGIESAEPEEWAKLMAEINQSNQSNRTMVTWGPGR